MRFDFARGASGALVIRLVDHEQIGDFHDAGFDRLNIIAHAGHQNHDDDVRHSGDGDFILSHAYGFNQDVIEAVGAQQFRDMARSSAPNRPPARAWPWSG